MRAERTIGIADAGGRLEDLSEAVANSDLAVGLAYEDGDGQLRQLLGALGRDLADARVADRRRHLAGGGNGEAFGAVGIDRLRAWRGLAHKQACVDDVLGRRLVGRDDDARAEPRQSVE